MTVRPFLLAALLALAGCGAVPTVPDQTYYRLMRPQELPRAAQPAFRLPVVVEAFSADGLYADQALIYALDPDARELRQYHYQLWTDPPTRLLQRRLITELRAADFAPLVTDQLPASSRALRIRGVILRFDRVPLATGGFGAVVALKLRADLPGGEPLIDGIYHAGEPAATTALTATADAFGAAIDRIYAQFHADLVRKGHAHHGG